MACLITGCTSYPHHTISCLLLKYILGLSKLFICDCLSSYCSTIFVYINHISCINYINHVNNISHPILCTFMNQSGHYCVFMSVGIYIHHLYQLYKPFQSHNSYQSHSIDCTNTFSQIMIVYL